MNEYLTVAALVSAGFNSRRFKSGERLQWVNTVEKLCLEKCDDFICDLSDITYCRYEGVAEVA